MTAQTGILPPASPHARFLLVRQHQMELAGLKSALKSLNERCQQLQARFPEAALGMVVAFGHAFWKKLQGGIPAGFHSLAAINSHFTMPSEEGDVLVHVRSERADLCFALVQELMATLGDKVEVLEDVACFRYFEARDLTGFVDGTENPQTEAERANATLVAEGDYKDGSFVFAQRYIHQLNKWNKLDVATQEKVFGRTKADDIEMDDDTKPDNAHIARVVIEEDGEELEILRHSLPYGSASGEQGLFFIAYTRNLSIIDKMLANMFGSSDDGLNDRMLNFVTPVGGAYFFAPSQEMWHKVIG